MKFIPHRNKDNTMLLSVMYHSRRDTDGGPDCVEIVTKDLDTGKKEVHSIDNPEYEFYIPKEKHRGQEVGMPILPLSMVEMHKCKYNQMTNYIGKEIGGSLEEYIKSCRSNGNFKGLRDIHLYPDLYATDLPYETYVRCQWLLHNDNERVKLVTKGFFDIETDNKIPMKFTDDGTVPINAISYVDNENKNAFLFLLRHPDNPQIAEFETRIDEFVAELHSILDERYPGLRYHVRMYDNERELDMIADFFHYINITKPDMVGGWNAGSFDYPVILKRIAYLGGDARDIICHPDFRIKRIHYMPDRRSNVKPEQRADVFKVSGYTNFIDSMTSYAGFRKSKGVISSLKLTDVAQKEIGDEKLDYGEAEDMNTFAWDDYWRFALYAMKDTVLLYGIEQQTSDMDALYIAAYTNAANYENAFKNTNFLHSRVYVDCFKSGFIITNNRNKIIRYRDMTPEDEEKEKKKKADFDGALVADPLLNSREGMDIFGVPSMFVFEDVVDMD